MRKLLTGSLCGLGMLVLILDGQTAIKGAENGIELCIRTVIPSLFPFFMLSTLLTVSISSASSPILQPISRLFGTPKGTESLLLTAFLGGYPVGAQVVSTAWKNGQLDRPNAQRMLYFCNNAGPSFLFGMVSAQFSSPRYAWMIWTIQILSAAAVARTIPPAINAPMLPRNTQQLTVTQALQNALRIMASVCGWVVIFRVVIAFLNRWFLWLLPSNLQVLLTGCLELANGCIDLVNVENEEIRFIVCCTMLSFGGLCVFMQTSSVLDGLSSRTYLMGKCLQTLYATALAVAVVWLPPSLYPLLAIPVFLLLPWFFGKTENKYSVSTKGVV